jgi:hypothetical protein
MSAPIRFRCKTCGETFHAWSPAERHARESHHARVESTTVEVTE